jgi:phosphoserine phosphatase
MSAAQLLVVLDVDSTLTRDEGIDLLAESVSPKVAAEVSAITAAAMRGEIDFAQSLTQRVRALAGVSRATIEQATARVRITDGAHHLVTTLHAHGHLVGAVSGGFHEMVDPLALELGLDMHRANRFEWEGDALTGGILGPLIDAAAKERTLLEWAQAHHIDLARTVAIGDGGNDVAMLRRAGVGIAFMAKPVAKDAADVIIDTPDLSRVLDTLGIGRL